MSVVEFKEIPEDYRVELEESAEKQFWKTIDEFGGVREFCNVFEYSESKMYNYRSKDISIPVKLVRQVLGLNCSDDIVSLKGPGRSQKIENPEFPLAPNSELLTRISCSVNVNKNGIPVYQTDERALAERFGQLLQQYGNVPYKIYSRNVYELRYPKFLHKILADMNYTRDVGAFVDEKGQITDGKVSYGEKEVGAKSFDYNLYSRRKRYRLAIARNDSEEIKSILGELGQFSQNGT